IMDDKKFSNSISIKHFFVKILALLGLFFAARVLFLCCNYHLLRSASTHLLIRAFFIGAYVDIMTIFTVNVLVFLIWFLPVRWKANATVVRCSNLLFFVVNFLALFVNVVDAKYFSFSYRRMSSDIFKETVLLTEDPEVYVEMLKQFWYVTLTGCLMLVALFFTSFKFRVVRKIQRVSWREYVVFIIGVAVGIICIRGGFYRRSLKTIDTLAYIDEPIVASLANNSALNIIHTFKQKSLSQVHYFQTDDEALAFYSPKHQPMTSLAGKFRGKNVVIIILESFSGEYVGGIDQQFKKEGTRSFTPFLDSLMEKSYVFDAFANGRISVDALVSIAIGIPPLFDSTFVVSRYAENVVAAWPKLLSKAGYQTMFFCGGHRNSCHFDRARLKAGLKAYFNRGDYDGPKEDIRAWGVYDDRFLQFVARKVDATKQPFVSVVFTLSSHHPYLYPAEFNGKFPKDVIPLPEFIAYADYSLQKFFETAEKMDWYKDTIFILVADHTSGQQQPYYVNNVGGFSIPLIIFDPNGGLVGRSDTVVQQIDIMPTILNLLGYDQPYFAIWQ
ncbi:MAG: sulfatase-like hydrolase/transferase, partial [Opitutales bacterium]|nr:sulfatase-like hydrolase/transferase [Opitutales bacterium]